MAEQQDSDQINRDIDEALRRAGADHLPSEPQSRSLFRLPFDPRPAGPEQVVVAGIVLLVLWRFGLLRAFGLVAADVGLLLLAFGILSWFIRPGRRTVYWRDRVIDVSGGLTWLERVYYWVYKG